MEGPTLATILSARRSSLLRLMMALTSSSVSDRVEASPSFLAMWFANRTVAKTGKPIKYTIQYKDEMKINKLLSYLGQCWGIRRNCSCRHQSIQSHRQVCKYRTSHREGLHPLLWVDDQRQLCPALPGSWLVDNSGKLFAPCWSIYKTC